jgi:hypothetical protein
MLSNRTDLIDERADREWLLSCQSLRYGGIARDRDSPPGKLDRCFASFQSEVTTDICFVNPRRLSHISIARGFFAASSSGVI